MNLKIDMDNVIILIIEDIVNLFKKVEGDDYFIKTSINNEEGVYGFFTSEFSFYYSREGNRFFLSFAVGVSGKKAAEATLLISSILDFKEFQIVDDHYVDIENQEMLFGYDAIIKKNEDIITQSGKVKCPICEGVYVKKLIKDSGFCIFCDSNKDKLTWN